MSPPPPSLPDVHNTRGERMDDLRARFPALTFLRLRPSEGLSLARPFDHRRDRLSQAECAAFGLDEPFPAGHQCTRPHGCACWFISRFHGPAWFDPGDGTRRPIAAGELLCWRPGSFIRYGAYVGQTYTHSYLFPGGPGTDQLMRRLQLPVCRPFQSLDRHAFNAWMYVIIRTRLREPADPQLVEQAVACLLTDCADATTADAGVPQDWQELRLLLDTRFAAPWTLAGLARRMRLSPAHLSRCFKRYYGIGPIDHLIGRRLEHAAHLLATTDLRIAAIAEAVGYDDPQYFARLFRRHRGLSPSAYRS